MFRTCAIQNAKLQKKILFTEPYILYLESFCFAGRDLITLSSATYRRIHCRKQFHNGAIHISENQKNTDTETINVLLLSKTISSTLSKYRSYPPRRPLLATKSTVLTD